MKNKFFIKTDDEYTADLLRNAGFQELAKEGSKWVFLNDNENKQSKFDFSEANNVYFSDKLNF